MEKTHINKPSCYKMFVVPFDEVRKSSKHQMPIKQEKNM